MMVKSQVWAKARNKRTLTLLENIIPCGHLVWVINHEKGKHRKAQTQISITTSFIVTKNGKLHISTTGRRTVVCTCNGYYLADKREETITARNTQKSLNYQSSGGSQTVRARRVHLPAILPRERNSAHRVQITAAPGRGTGEEGRLHWGRWCSGHIQPLSSDFGGYELTHQSVNSKGAFRDSVWHHTLGCLELVIRPKLALNSQ